VANRTTTTTVVQSRKDSDGNWEPYERTVTTVVERDDEGYPYGPVQRDGKARYGLDMTDYFRVYDAWKRGLGKDGQNG
jgi:hypothetical protein